MIRDIFQKMSSWTQLFFLCFFSFTGLIIGSLVIYGTLHIADFSQANAIDLRKMQTIYVIFTFLLPALLCASLFYKQPEVFLKINRGIDFNIIVLSIALIILVQPAINVMSIWNGQIPFPESMAGIEQSFKNATKQNEEIINKMLIGDTSQFAWVWNLLVIAVLAAIVEEFFFRGIIQQLIVKIVRNAHVGIWIGAVIFSAVHFDFYGFIPRVLLGALLGYLFLWSQSLWLPILIHFVNNGITVLIYPHFYQNESYKTMGTGDSWWWSVVCLLPAIAIIAYMVKKHNREQAILNM